MDVWVGFEQLTVFIGYILNFFGEGLDSAAKNAVGSNVS